METVHEFTNSAIGVEDGSIIGWWKLSSIVPTEKNRVTFKQLAAEEGHHASVFFKMTNKTLQPRKTKAVLLGIPAHIVGWKILLYLIAQGEYSAFKKYEKLIKDFPEVDFVRDDENRHGDIMLTMKKNFNFRGQML